MVSKDLNTKFFGDIYSNGVLVGGAPLVISPAVPGPNLDLEVEPISLNRQTYTLNNDFSLPLSGAARFNATPVLQFVDFNFLTLYVRLELQIEATGDVDIADLSIAMGTAENTNTNISGDEQNVVPETSITVTGPTTGVLNITVAPQLLVPEDDAIFANVLHSAPLPGSGGMVFKTGSTFIFSGAEIPI